MLRSGHERARRDRPQHPNSSSCVKHQLTVSMPIPGYHGVLHAKVPAMDTIYLSMYVYRIHHCGGNGGGAGIGAPSL